MRTAAGNVGGRVIIVDRRGRLLADSAGSGLGTASYASRPEIRTALAGDTFQGTRHSASLGENLLFTAVPIVSAGQARGRRAHHPVRRRRALRGAAGPIALIGLGLAALALGLIVAWLLAGYLSRPLRGLTKAARRVEAGDLDARAAEAGGRSTARSPTRSTT